MRSHIATLKTTTAEGENLKVELTNIRRRFEKQRVETIELATQFQTAQREIRQLSASLAEARLQIKFAQATQRAAKAGHTKSDFANMLEIGDLDGEELILAPPTPLPSLRTPGRDEPLTDKEIKSTLGAMRHCFQTFTKTPTDLSLLNELHCHVESFTQSTRVSGLPAVHRLCAAFSGLTQGLYQNPAQVNPSTLRTVHQTIEFLAALLKEKHLAQMKDPSTAHIYAVDDDLGNCESIALAMEESALRTTYSQEPTAALAQLAVTHYDLIFLDVNLPGMDGFELCKNIRNLAIHENTPIVFLTGLATLENRVQSSLSGGNDFIAKPFNLFELSVKAITLILRSQLSETHL